MSMTSTFRSLRHPNYRLWFFGQGASLVGTWMQFVAQQLLIYRLTGSAAALGTISLIGLIPLIPLSLWSGSLVDRFPKRTVILVCQAGMMVQALIMAALLFTDTVQIWHVYVLSFFLGVFNAVDLPARQSIVVELVEGKADLSNAIGLNSALFNLGRALGPAMAGVVVAATGEAWAFFINALTFAVFIVALLFMRNLPAPAPDARKNSRTAAHMLEGMRFIFKQQTLLILVTLVGVSAFLSMPYSTLMPVFAGNVLVSSAQPFVNTVCTSGLITCLAPEALPLGLLTGLMGFGALIGALLVASLPETAPRGLMLTIGNLGFPALLIGFAFSKSFVTSLVLMFFVGVAFVWQNVLANTLIQFASPDAMRGRVMSFYTMSFQAMMRLGGMQAGLLADGIGAPLTVGIGAVISLIYGLFVLVRYPKVRQLQ
ncbi:MAG TPA: MFS transporter [Anaerolineaceae bacterium]|nr:MFS transporter [Anaerolineaceae bacterium]